MSFWNSYALENANTCDGWGYPEFNDICMTNKWYNLLTDDEKNQYDKRKKQYEESTSEIFVFERKDIIRGHILEIYSEENKIKYAYENYIHEEWYECTDNVIKKLIEYNYTETDDFELNIGDNEICIDINKLEKKFNCGLIEEITFEEKGLPIIKINNKEYEILRKNVDSMILNIFVNKIKIYYSVTKGNYIDCIKICQ